MLRSFLSNPKLDFRESPTGIQRLVNDEIPPSDPFWDQFFLLFDSHADVDSLIDHSVVVSAARSYPQNIRTLVTVLLSRVRAPLVFDAPSTSMYLQKSLGFDNSTTRRVLNALRVITRVVSIVYATESQTPEAHALFFHDDNLATVILETLITFLFVPNFTLASDSSRTTFTGDPVIELWGPGIVSQKESSAPPSIMSARVELVSFLCIILSVSDIVRPPGASENPWRVALDTFALDPSRKKISQAFFASILNVSFPSQDSFWKSLPTDLLVPKTTAVSPLESARSLSRHALLLSTLLTTMPNFSTLLAKIHKPADVNFLVRSILANLTARDSPAALLASWGLARQSSVANPLLLNLILFFFLLQNNAHIVSFICATPPLAPHFLLALLSILDDYVETEPQIALLAALSIQTFTAGKDIPAQINSPFPSHVPRYNASLFTTASPPVPPAASEKQKVSTPPSRSTLSYFLAFLRVFLQRNVPVMSSLVQPLVLAIANVTSSIASLPGPAAVDLTEIFLAFSTHTFLFRNPSNPRILFYVLQAINAPLASNIYHNTPLLAAALRVLPRIHALANISLHKSESVDASMRTNSFIDPNTLDPNYSPLSVAHIKPNSKHAFVPTESWIASWRDSLPVNSLLMILSLLPEHITPSGSSALMYSSQPLLHALSKIDLSATLVHSDFSSIAQRAFRLSDHTLAWFSSLIFGQIYLAYRPHLSFLQVKCFSLVQA